MIKSNGTVGTCISESLRNTIPSSAPIIRCAHTSHDHKDFRITSGFSLAIMLLVISVLTLLHCATALVARAPTPAKAPVCTSGLYGKLAPLATLPAAQAFCSLRYPLTSTVTKVQRRSASESPLNLHATSPKLTSALPPLRRPRDRPRQPHSRPASQRRVQSDRLRHQDEVQCLL